MGRGPATSGSRWWPVRRPDPRGHLQGDSRRLTASSPRRGSPSLASPTTSSAGSNSSAWRPARQRRTQDPALACSGTPPPGLSAHARQTIVRFLDDWPKPTRPRRLLTHRPHHLTGFSPSARIGVHVSHAGAGPGHELSFTDRVIATLVISRFQLPHAALAVFYGGPVHHHPGCARDPAAAGRARVRGAGQARAAIEAPGGHVRLRRLPGGCGCGLTAPRCRSAAPRPDGRGGGRSCLGRRSRTRSSPP